MAKETTKRGPGRPKGSKNKKSKEENIPKVPKSKEEQIKEMQLKNRNDSRVNDAIWAVAIFALGVFFFFTIITDTTGAFGAYIHDVCMGLFGVIAYVMPFYFIVYAVLLMLKKMQHINIRTVVFSVVLFLDLCILNSYRFIDPAKLQFGFGDIANYYTKGVAGEMGGAVGMELGSLIIKGFGASGLLIFGIALLLICLLLIVNTPISEGIEKFREKREAKRLLRQMEEAEARSIIDRVQEAPVITQAAAAPAHQYSEPVVSKPVIEVSPSPAAQASAPSNEPEYTPFEVINNKPTVLPTESFDREDDYEKNVAKISYGLDGDVPLRTGYGLDGYGSDNFVSGSGTKGLVPEAVKRDDYVPSNEPSYQRPSEPVVKTYTDTPSPAPAPEALETKEEVKVRKPVKRATKKEIEEDMNEDDLTLEKDLESAVSGGNEVKMYTLPSANLLKTPKRSTSALSESQLQNKAMLLEETLRNFGVSATVLKVTQGASVTRYEVQPATGVKVNKITSLADDIALNMRAKSIRMEAPIPGKAAVGIEIENDKAAPVLIKELIDSEEFRNSSSKISFVVGKDISGNNIVADLKGMPHMLIAGATGSGKSVCINTIITSILYKANPYEVKFIMIDPKVVELGNYNGIPHMSIPVVTDPKKAARALNWAVGEMNKRYEEFANVRVKDLESYNDYARANHMEVKPQIVIIIDELADLMMAAPSQVEESICRLAQKARAAGMHLIVATQRPSVDIVTGVIKANIPSRIAFSVSSQFDSRTILDMAGAEKLLGKGDMLFYPVGANKPLRVQGPYISDAETQAVIDYAKKQADPDYNEELSSDINSEAEPGKGGSGNSNAAPDKDELTDDAIEFIIKSKQASVSMLQRRFRIGYNRAARIIDEIEAMGIIGPSDGSRPRQVLMTEEEYYGMDEQLTVDEIEDTDADEYEE